MIECGPQKTQMKLGAGREADTMLYRVPCVCGWAGLWRSTMTGAILSRLSHEQEAARLEVARG